MLLEFILPVVGFPLIALLVQVTLPLAPHPDIWEKYGPLGIIVGWFMLKDWREETRRAKHDRELSAALKDMAASLSEIRTRPCLLESEHEAEEQQPPRRRPKHGD